MAEEIRLYGPPFAEVLWRDEDRAWEETDGDVLEEFSVHPPVKHLPSVEQLCEWLAEWACENGEIDEASCEQFDDAAGADDVRDAASLLLNRMAAHITHYMADEQVGTLKRLG